MPVSVVMMIELVKPKFAHGAVLTVLAGLALACQSPIEPGQQILPIPPETNSQLGDSLELSLDVPGENLLGRPVPLVVRLRNVGSTTVTLSVGAQPQTHDFRVLDLREREIWRFQANISMPRFEPRTLAPGQELVYGAEWPQLTATGAAVGIGDYKVKGIIFGEGGNFTTATLAFLIR